MVLAVGSVNGSAADWKPYRRYVLLRLTLGALAETSEASLRRQSHTFV